MRNCTTIGAVLTPGRSNDGTNSPVVIRETACDGTTVTTSGAGVANTYYDYNAFLQGATRTTPTGAHDQIVTNFNWQTSWLGNYYLPSDSPLIDAGGVTADTIGLYHYTTQTNQVKETTTTLDLSYHYVAVDSNGKAIDSSGAGPDYWKDANGNGLVDSGEIGWNITGDLGLKVLITEPKPKANIP